MELKDIIARMGVDEKLAAHPRFRNAFALFTNSILRQNGEMDLWASTTYQYYTEEDIEKIVSYLKGARPYDYFSEEHDKFVEAKKDSSDQTGGVEDCSIKVNDDGSVEFSTGRIEFRKPDPRILFVHTEEDHVVKYNLHLDENGNLVFKINSRGYNLKYDESGKICDRIPIVGVLETGETIIYDQNNNEIETKYAPNKVYDLSGNICSDERYVSYARRFLESGNLSEEFLESIQKVIKHFEDKGIYGKIDLEPSEADIKEELDKLQTEMEDLESQEVELLGSLNSVRESIKAKKERINSLSSKLEQTDSNGMRM